MGYRAMLLAQIVEALHGERMAELERVAMALRLLGARAVLFSLPADEEGSEGEIDHFGIGAGEQLGEPHERPQLVVVEGGRSRDDRLRSA